MNNIPLFKKARRLWQRYGIIGNLVLWLVGGWVLVQLVSRGALAAGFPPRRLGLLRNGIWLALVLAPWLYSRVTARGGGRKRRIDPWEQEVGQQIRGLSLDKVIDRARLENPAVYSLLVAQPHLLASAIRRTPKKAAINELSWLMGQTYMVPEELRVLAKKHLQRLDPRYRSLSA